ncbi:MAG: anaerobic glycerol-3-phosphate dehydrogenase subunit A [Chloroflexaceae bacterium]|nr:anaerobic glycerol-3-phosphate dehydrogenase subunit A [Chloroflexaceae bacterium]
MQNTTRQIQTDVLVIGGGATGLGTVRDLAMRGIRTVLVEKGDLTHGTTGRYHGLLHSGGRYVVKDPQSATECAEENAILRRIMPQYIEDTSGFFVITPWDDPDYGDRFLKACHDTRVPVQEISVEEALRREPVLNPKISRVFEVPDGSADSFMSAYGIARSATQYGASILNYHFVTDLVREGDRIVAAIVEDLRTGEHKRIEATYILNTAGAWAGKIAQLADLRVNVMPGKGTMIAMNHRMVNTVINRCKLPADGDILVPIHTVSVIGTTDIHVLDPDVYGIEPDEVTFLMEEGEKMIPGFTRYRALRAWAGVRPLYREESSAVSDRDVSRAYKLLDHRKRDGVDGFISIVGGKWTTYRLMAEEIVDIVAARLGVSTPCRTAQEVIPGGEESKLYWLGHNLAHVEADDSYGDLLCECELVTRKQVVQAIRGGAANLDDVRRETRLGMGPCQGGFCTYRAAALWGEVKPDAVPTNAKNNGKLAQDGAGMPGTALVRHFLQERWKGLTSIMWGDQLRQARLDQLIYVDTLGIDLLPEHIRPPQPENELVTGHPAIATEYHHD